MLDCDKKQLDKKDDRSELKETSTCQAILSFTSDPDSMSNMDLLKLNISEIRPNTGKYFAFKQAKPFKKTKLSLIFQLIN